MPDLRRLFQTLRHLRPRQVAFQLLYRATGRLTKRPENAGRGARVPAPLAGQAAEPVTFSFLNRSVTFPGPGSIDWNYSDLGKLWTYNLNYFEFADPDRPALTEALIDSWIVAEGTHKDGWEPYPLSLRLVAWLDYYDRLAGRVPDHVAASLQRQYDALWQRVEYHLGGNHLLENALALTVAAHHFQDSKRTPAAERLLRAELSEQYLPDGAHYELSPMYHLILLDRMLTVYRLLERVEPAPAIVGTLRRSLVDQLAWAEAFCTADGRFAHFNDSTDGIAPAWPEVRAEAERLGLSAKPAHLGASGYRRFSTDRLDVWVDAAAIGPDYIPGHAHADNLTFSLHLDGRAYIVDTAISTYEKNVRRRLERSTISHNTVTVAAENSSDVWGGFRVGKRARTRIETDSTTDLVAKHDGYPGGHRRAFRVQGGGLRITDQLGEGVEGEALFHFATGLEVKLSHGHCRAGDLRISWRGGTARLEPYHQAVGWNETRPARRLVVSFTTAVSFTLTPEPKHT